MYIKLKNLGIKLAITLVVLLQPLLIVQKVHAACAQTVTTNAGDNSAGSLKNAISSASTGETVCFNIPGSGVHTIAPSSTILLNQGIILDATTQPGYSGAPLIELNGNNSVNFGFQVSGGSNTIKGFAINRFKVDGIFVQSQGNTILANHIGLDPTGTIDRGNGGSGIGIVSSNNVIGGSTAADRNVISGNNGIGIVIQDTGAGTTNNVVKGNYIGTNAAGTSAIPNGNPLAGAPNDGVLINWSSGNTIGGTIGTTPRGACTGDCNLISGNSANGIGLLGKDNANGEDATNNTFIGNYIGTNAAGTSAIPNGDIGIELQQAASNTIGGTSAAARNVVSGNKGAGISLTRAGAHYNTVIGNYIGTNSAGNAAVKNQKMGVNIGSPNGGSDNAHRNTIGGTTGTTPGSSCTGSCNVIAGNAWGGVYISGSNGGSNQLAGNFIGNGASGGSTIPNVQDGIGIVNSPNNKIGGPSANARNIISGNGGNGIAITGGYSNGTRIEGNYIGIATDQNIMSNQVSGVAVGGGVDTAILANGIYGNGFLGIDVGLGGVTFNDGGDPDNGPNRLQNFPTMSYVVPMGNSTNFVGSFNSNANTSYRIELFSSPACNSQGYGQGHTYIGGTTVVTSATGNTNFNILLPTTVPGGSIVTATATKLGGATAFESSEFSGCVNVPRQHPDGALIRPAGSSSLFIVESGKNGQLGSVEVLLSHFIDLKEFKTATTTDTSAPGGTGLYFREGTVIKGSSSDVFVIDKTDSNTYQKRKITSNQVFNELGYGMADIIQINDSALGIPNGTDITNSNQHPDGTLIKSGITIYLLEGGKKRLVGSPGVYTSHRLSAAKLKNAIPGDISLASDSNLQYREGALVRGNSSSTVFVIDENNGSTRKRQFGSIQSFIELGYTNSDIIVIPDNEVPPITGPAI